MTAIAATMQPSFQLAVGLTALLAVSVRQNRPPLLARVAVPGWVPWLSLGFLATASTAFRILHPEAFAVAFGDGAGLPETAATMLSQL